MDIGDKVTRIIAGMPMYLEITAIDDQFIYCGDWKFDKFTGAEIDEELGWNNSSTGSYIEELWQH